MVLAEFRFKLIIGKVGMVGFLFGWATVFCPRRFHLFLLLVVAILRPSYWILCMANGVFTEGRYHPVGQLTCLVQGVVEDRCK